ncbi:ABC-three component system middle component 8 [Mycobacterium pinniadriaticum]|uniref:ABC-three component system middle component 8 n=1 Tax=Mycobacterium pinniadriaticum TaxID=2994102 RepID=UPI003898D8CC
MLIPSKHDHPDQTVLSVSSILLRQLRRQRIAPYADLVKIAKRKVKGGEVLFVPAINLLYALGLVEYRRKVDSFEYVGPR